MNAFLLLFPALALAAPQQPPPEAAAQVRAASARIDELVLGQLGELGIPPAALCDDGVFLRRAFLDLTGTLPTLVEARRFLTDARAGKRSRLVDDLLARPEFADYWAMKWGDALRVKAEFPINLWPNGAQAYHRWIRDSIEDELPFDQFARELLTASGSCYRRPAVNFFRAVQGKDPEALAQAVALTFLGARYSAWPDDRRAGLAAVFSRLGFKATREWKEEIVYFDPGMPVVGSALLPDGAELVLHPGAERRGGCADWLIAPEKPGCGRVAADRIWAGLLGRGVVHELDGFRPDNPPANPALLDFLADEFAASGWDRKFLLRAILNSQTYQRSAIPAGEPVAAAAQFACYSIRPLEAEVLVDALNQITGTTESYTSAIPEPFTFIPPDARAQELPDGSITSPFLELFGRPPRDTGLDSERSRAPTAAQRLHLLNSSHVWNKFQRGGGIRALGRGAKEPARLVEDLYLTFLSRFPTAGERQVISDYAASGVANSQQAALDLVWVLLNSSEFLYRH
ncbi:MAG: DUF1553 domain-containing protein [Planctomycetes bacterium]|nr:DUF1553 domain-containing protein [Planctomycetota bacterium]